MLATGLILELPSLAELAAHAAAVEEDPPGGGARLLGGAAADDGARTPGELRAAADELDRFDDDDRAWVAWSVTRRGAEPPQGRFNAGQKLNAAMIAGLMVVFTVSGTLMYLSEVNARFRGTNAILIHDVAMVVAIPLVLGHLFLVLVNPSTRPSLRGMVRGACGATGRGAIIRSGRRALRVRVLGSGLPGRSRDWDASASSARRTTRATRGCAHRCCWTDACWSTPGRTSTTSCCGAPAVPEAMLLTHAHHDHVLGIHAMAKLGRLRLHMTKEAERGVRRIFPQLDLRVMHLTPGVQARARRWAGGAGLRRGPPAGTRTLAFRFSSDGRRRWSMRRTWARRRTPSWRAAPTCW